MASVNDRPPSGELERMLTLAAGLEAAKQDGALVDKGAAAEPTAAHLPGQGDGMPREGSGSTLGAGAAQPPQGFATVAGERSASDLPSSQSKPLAAPVPHQEAAAKVTKRRGVPWKNAKVRQNLLRQVQLRLDEPTVLMLDWLQRRGIIRAKNPFFNSVLGPVIHSKVREVMLEDGLTEAEISSLGVRTPEEFRKELGPEDAYDEAAYGDIEI